MKLKTLKTQGSTILYQENNSISSHEKSMPLIRQAGTCQYLNSVNFQNVLVENVQTDKIKIINQLCSQNGDILQKVTTIKFGNQIITIRDSYKFDRLGPSIGKDLAKKRVQIFKKPLNLSANTEHSACDAKSRLTKNLPKNFIKAFINYLQDVKCQSNKQMLSCKIQLLSSRQKYNNSFIQRIVDDEYLQSFFRDFLQNHAQIWIKNSKIRNKQIHLQAISVFLNLGNNKPNDSLNKNNATKPDLTNSFNNSQYNSNSFSNQQQNIEQSQQIRSHHFMGHSQQIQSQKDSILANQSKNFCIDQR